MKTAIILATFVASATAFAPAAQQQTSTSLNMAGYQDRFYYPKPTGGMNDKTMGWKMPETVERQQVPATLENFTPRPTGGMNAKTMGWRMPETVERGPEQPEAKKAIIKPYGEDHQANAKGGKGPLGKVWTTKMDQTYKQGQERFHPFK